MVDNDWETIKTDRRKALEGDGLKVAALRHVLVELLHLYVENAEGFDPEDDEQVINARQVLKDTEE